MNEHVERLIHALSNPSIYPHHPDSVQVIQTHISIVFLAGEFVYKVKKPLSLGFLDFTTIEKRKFFCQQEVDLNSRYSRDIYLGVVAIHESQVCGVNIRGDGAEIEYAVLMRLIPEDKILLNALAHDLVDETTIDRVADSILKFHLQAARGPQISIFGAPEVIMHNVRENFYQTEPFIGKTISSETFELIRRESFIFMEQNKEFLEKRVKEGHIRDCHGDLHLDHVVLFDQIMLVDCIEFNDRFRYSDQLADLAFLLMDLDFLGYHAFSNRVLKRYMRDFPDENAQNLLQFYKSYRAYVRGKVQSFTLNEPEVDEKSRIRSAAIASDYFLLSRAYFEPKPEPALIITCGLMGSGKTFLATRLAKRSGAQIIRSDVIRKQSLGLAPSAHRLDNYGEGIYTRKSSEKTYQTLFNEASAALKRRESVILDASFARRSDRMTAKKLARDENARFMLIQCEAPDDVIHSRLVDRIKQSGEPSDGRWELYHKQKADFEAIGNDENEGYVKYLPNIDINEILTPIAKEIAFGPINRAS